MDAPVAIRVRRSTPDHDAYTVRLYDNRFAVLATARPADVRRWVATTRWLHPHLLHRGRLVVGLGVQWTATLRPLGGAPPHPATLQLCVGHRCLVFHLAQASAVPEALHRFLADPRVTFVGSGSANDCRMLWAYYGLHVTCGRELRAMAAGMGNASMEEMADRFLGYPGITKSRVVAMSAWHAPRLSMYQVLYAAVDAYLAFRLGVHLCQPDDLVHQAPPAPVLLHSAPPARRLLVLDTPLPAFPRGPVLIHAPPPVQQRDPVLVRSRQAPPASRVINHAMPRVECSPWAFSGLAVTADTETDYDSDVGDAVTHDGLPVRAYYASDSEDDDYSSNGFEHVAGWFGAFTDDEEEDEDDGSVTDQDFVEDDNTVCTGLGTYEEDGEIGILTIGSNRDDRFTADAANVDEDDGGGCAFDDDWNDPEEYGCDDLDDDDGSDDYFYLL